MFIQRSSAVASENLSDLEDMLILKSVVYVCRIKVQLQKFRHHKYIRKNIQPNDDIIHRKMAWIVFTPPASSNLSPR